MFLNSRSYTKVRYSGCRQLRLRALECLTKEMKYDMISAVAMLAVFHGAHAFAPSSAGLMRQGCSHAAISSCRPPLRAGRAFALKVWQALGSVYCIYTTYSTYIPVRSVVLCTGPGQVFLVQQTSRDREFVWIGSLCEFGSCWDLVKSDASIYVCAY